MRRIYRRRFMKVRFWSAVLILGAVALVSGRMMQIGAPPESAAFALVRAANLAPVVFAAGGVAWLLYRFWDAVGTFDVDIEVRRFRLVLWRPLGWRNIEGDMKEISGWRYEGRRPPTILGRLDHPPLALTFEVGSNWRPGKEWRRIAPGAVAAYERDMAAKG